MFIFTGSTRRDEPQTGLRLKSRGGTRSRNGACREPRLRSPRAGIAVVRAHGRCCTFDSGILVTGRPQRLIQAQITGRLAVLAPGQGVVTARHA